MIVFIIGNTRAYQVTSLTMLKVWEVVAHPQAILQSYSNCPFIVQCTVVEPKQQIPNLEYIFRRGGAISPIHYFLVTQITTRFQ